MPTIDCLSDDPDDAAFMARYEAERRRANAALARYFARRSTGRSTKADARVAAILATLKPHLRATLTMQHTPRTWPATLVAECRSDTSLVVRLYCADHPAVGTTADLESAAAETLAALVSQGQNRVVRLLHVRAMIYFFRAETAFCKAFEAQRIAAR